jgi:LuxR family maltose regulon positive regulatory protein
MRTDAPAAVREQILAQQVRVKLALGRLVEAERVLQSAGLTFMDASSMSNFSAISPNLYQFGVLVNSALRLILCQAQTSGDTGRLHQGIELAHRLIHDTLQRQLLPIALEALLLRAEMYAELSNTQASHDDYLQAVALAEPEGFISRFVNEGEPVRIALTALLQGNPPNAGYLQQILAAFVTAPPDSQPSSLVEPLTEREREVLRLMAQGLKYQEIADTLVISLNTVRFYVKEIYSKLGVNNRTHALELARQQSLI